jgi:hypothetical protein
MPVPSELGQGRDVGVVVDDDRVAGRLRDQIS